MLARLVTDYTHIRRIGIQQLQGHIKPPRKAPHDHRRRKPATRSVRLMYLEHINQFESIDPRQMRATMLRLGYLEHSVTTVRNLYADTSTVVATPPWQNIFHTKDRHGHDQWGCTWPSAFRLFN